MIAGEDGLQEGVIIFPHLKEVMQEPATEVEVLLEEQEKEDRSEPLRPVAAELPRPRTVIKEAHHFRRRCWTTPG
jgi:hypothetical protein